MSIFTEHGGINLDIKHTTKIPCSLKRLFFLALKYWWVPILRQKTFFTQASNINENYFQVNVLPQNRGINAHALTINVAMPQKGKK